MCHFNHIMIKTHHQAREHEVEQARTQLAGVIEELEGARGQTEGMLRRMRALEGREQVRGFVGVL